MMETIRWLMAGVGFLGLLAIYYWTWHSFVRPFVGNKLGWMKKFSHPKIELIGKLGGYAFLFCTSFLPMLGRAGS